MEFNFPKKERLGIEKLAPHIPPDCLNLMYLLLAYNPEERISAGEALKHPYFSDLNEIESLKVQKKIFTSKIILKEVIQGKK